jgi:hypothetical protein
MRRAAIALCVALLGIILWLVTGHTKQTTVVSLEAPPPSPQEFTPPSREAVHGAAVTPNRMLKDYEKYSAYPPNSRPVTPERAAAFKYNHRVLEPLPVIPRGQEEPAFFSEFTADKLMVFGTDTITLTLRASHPTDSSAAFAIQMRNAGLTRGRGSKSEKIVDLYFHDDGRDGDLVAGDSTYTVVLRPSKMAPLAEFHGSVRAFVDYSANDVEFGQQLFFDYYPDEGIAARFTGNYREAIEDGSLVVYAEMAVARAGFYSVDATLDTEDDRAFCHSRFKGTLDEGTREARLLFFGKAIRDADPTVQGPFKVTVQGPFKVVEIYGQMVPEPGRLLELAKDGDFAPWAVPLYDGYYLTKQYPVDSFSDAEWRGPEKDARLNDYQQLAERK